VLALTIGVVAVISVLVLLAVGVAMTLSVIFNADPYDDIHYTDD
jgi:hypothetical protein